MVRAQVREIDQSEREENEEVQDLDEYDEPAFFVKLFHLDPQAQYAFG